MLAAMHFAELTPAEQRVLGCLIEKRWTTPDQYPLSLNGLRLACNQSTNRDPVTSYDEGTVREAAQRLYLYGLTRLASGQGSRAVKYRHLAEEALGLGREELAVLAVLLLRGAQTPGELKARTERMAPLGSLADVERVLQTLTEREYIRRIGRRPGQKEDRFEHLLGGAGGGEAGAAAPGAGGGEVRAAAPVAAGGEVWAAGPGVGGGQAAMPPQTQTFESFSETQAPVPAQTPPASANGGLAERVAALEAEVAALRSELDELRELYG